MTAARFDELAPSLFVGRAESWAVFDAVAGYNTFSGAGIDGRAASYRYLLGREIGQGKSGRVGFVLLNPSTADHETNDATIRKCIGFAKLLGASELLVANCYAFRATDPKKLITARDPVGPLNEQALTSLARHCDTLICGWGRHARARGVETGKLLAKHARTQLLCLGLNKDGSPKHPLYVPYPKFPQGVRATLPLFNPYNDVEIGRV